MIGVLTFLYALSFMNRQIPILMVDPLRQGLALSEVQIGLVTGFAFAFFYAVFGLPFGWLVDHYQRKLVFLLGMLIMSLATIYCGLATSFPELLIGRFMLGIGTAAIAPAAFSMISDSFASDRLAFASAAFSSGANIGSALALAGGGLLVSAVPAAGTRLPILGHVQGWQLVFLACAAPSFLFAWLVLTVREPSRTHPLARGFEELPASGILSFMRARKQFFICHFLAFSLLPASAIAVTVWMPTYLMRIYDLTPSQAGPAIALMVGIGCSIGGMSIGAVADRFFRRGVTDSHMRIYIPLVAFQLIALAGAVSTSNLYMCLAMTAFFYSTLSFSGVAVTALSTVTPGHYRGRVTAIFIMTFTLAGSGFGPLLTASVTRYVYGDETMLGWSMLTVNAFLLPLVALALFCGLRPYRNAIATRSCAHS